MDIPTYNNQNRTGGYNYLGLGNGDDTPFDDEFFEVSCYLSC